MSNLKYKHTAYTSAQWASLNPVVVENEIVIESDTKRTKIGNGISTYNQLEYADANSVGNSLGSIKPTDAAPTPARNGNYTFSIGGNKPAWLTAEALVTEVKAGDGVAVVYTEPSSYTYTHVNMSSDLVTFSSLAKGYLSKIGASFELLKSNSVNNFYLRDSVDGRLYVDSIKGNSILAGGVFTNVADNGLITIESMDAVNENSTSATLTNISPLKKVANTCDEIQRDGNTYSIKRRIGVKILNGSETWVKAATGKYYTNTRFGTYDIKNLLVSSSRYIPLRNVDVSKFDGTISLAFDGNLVIYDTSFLDAASLQSSLASNPITVYYILASEVTEPITNELEVSALNNMVSHSGITVINITDSPQLVLTYIRNRTSVVITDIDKNNVKDLRTSLAISDSVKVLSKATTITDYDGKLIESPIVIWDDKLLKYVMVYTGYADDGAGNYLKGVIGYAFSDNLETWAKQGVLLAESGIEGTADYGSITGPYLYKENGIYYLYYIGGDKAGYEQGIKRLCLSTSTDLVNWTRHGAVITPSFSAKSWYKNYIYHPNIVKKDNIYYMFFNANGEDDFSTSAERIGFATSMNLQSWVVNENPSIYASIGGLDDQICGDPYLFDIGDDNYYMYYFGAQVPYTVKGTFLAYTKKIDFPNGWVKYNEGNPISVDINITKSSVIYKRGMQYHFYGSALSDGIRLIKS